MVSVVIPTLNEEYFIERCLDSVRQQSFPFEEMDLMVVDGGSTDRTCEIVREYSLKHPNVRLLHNPQKIQSAAFNIGYAQSSTPILIRLDAHALYDKEYIDRCVKIINTNGEVANVGGVCLIRPQHNGTVAMANALLNQSRFGIGGASFRVGGHEGYVDTVPFGAFPRWIIDKIGGMREDLPRGEDNEYNYRIRSAGYKVYFDPQIKADYFARDSIVSSARQMYQNGYSIAKLIHINPCIISLRHVVPFMFVSCLIILSLLSFITVYALYLLCFSLSIYAIGAIMASTAIARNNGIKYLFIMPILFFVIHLSYGWGTIMGLIYYVKW